MKKVQGAIGIGMLSLLLFTGCSSEEIVDSAPVPQKEEQKVENTQGESDKKEEVEQDNSTNQDGMESKKEMTVYYVDMNSAEIVSRIVEVEKVSPEIIWNCLQEEKLLTQECVLNDFKYDLESKTIDLDVNQGFGDYIRSMGTTGESEIIECIAKSYLETYHCNQIKFTENGQPLGTGHAILDDYITYE